jgi:tRNA pseudouridine55 synthase
LPEIHFRVVCSKGTYIRSLAHDFALALGSGGHLSALCRTRIGQHRLENSVHPKELEEIRKPQTEK